MRDEIQMRNSIVHLDVDGGTYQVSIYTYGQGSRCETSVYVHFAGGSMEQVAHILYDPEVTPKIKATHYRGAQIIERMVAIYFDDNHYADDMSLIEYLCMFADRHKILEEDPRV
jgi:hypothetical protein